MTLALLGNTLLRTAITRNLVTFPTQIQPFMKKRTTGDLQERIVQLYFLRGWSVRNIGDRYGMSKAMIHKLLAEWRIRAVESGYIQEIEPGCLSALGAEGGTDSLENGAGDKRGAVGDNNPLVVEHVIEHPDTTPAPIHVLYTGSIPAPIPVMMPVTEGHAILTGGRSA